MRELLSILGGIADAALALTVGLVLWPLDVLVAAWKAVAAWNAVATWQKRGRAGR